MTPRRRKAPPQPVADPHPFPLTALEHEVVADLGAVWGKLQRLVGDGRSRDADLGEAVRHVHALQNMVLAQAAARAYPDLYRLLGRSVTERAAAAEVVAGYTPAELAEAGIV